MGPHGKEYVADAFFFVLGEYVQIPAGHRLHKAAVVEHHIGERFFISFRYLLYKILFCNLHKHHLLSDGIRMLRYLVDGIRYVAAYFQYIGSTVYSQIKREIYQFFHIFL